MLQLNEKQQYTNHQYLTTQYCDVRCMCVKQTDMCNIFVNEGSDSQFAIQYITIYYNILQYIVHEGSDARLQFNSVVLAWLTVLHSWKLCHFFLGSSEEHCNGKTDFNRSMGWNMFNLASAKHYRAYVQGCILWDICKNCVGFHILVGAQCFARRQCTVRTLENVHFNRDESVPIVGDIHTKNCRRCVHIIESAWFVGCAHYYRMCMICKRCAQRLARCAPQQELWEVLWILWEVYTCCIKYGRCYVFCGICTQ